MVKRSMVLLCSVLNIGSRGKHRCMETYGALTRCLSGVGRGTLMAKNIDTAITYDLVLVGSDREL